MKILIPVIVGAFIGYITNYIAIKMLFFPYDEKRIFNLRIPFTPGLIPREKSRIAKAVGEAVGDYLLSPDVVVEVLFNREDSFRSKLKDKFGGLESKNKNIGEIIKEYFPNKKDSIRECLSDKLKKLLKSVIYSEEFKGEVFYLVKEILTGKGNEDFLRYIKELFKDKDISKAFEKEIEEFIKIEFYGKKLIEIIPEEYTDLLKDNILERREDICRALYKVINKSSVKFKISMIISKVLEKQFGKIVGALLNAGSISDKVIESVKEYLRDSNNQVYAAVEINNLLDNILEYKTEDLYKLFESNGENTIYLFLKKEVLSEDNIDRFLNYIKTRLEEDNLNTIVDKLNINWKEFIESIFGGYIDGLSVKLIDKLFNIKVCEILSIIEGEFIDELEPLIIRVVRNITLNIVKIIDIPSVVEKRIESFDAALTEKIILDVADRELKAITWLGALLGGIMGLFMPLIERLYS